MNAARVLPVVCYHKHWKAKPVVCRTWESSRQAQGRAGGGGAGMNAPVRKTWWCTQVIECGKIRLLWVGQGMTWGAGWSG